MALRLLGDRIVLWRDGEGMVHALENRCVHRLAPLSQGRCEGANLRCMYHGLLFGSDGGVLEIPLQDKVPLQARVRAYPVAVRHSWVWVWMGDPAQADENLIPPAVGYDDGRFILGHGHLDYAAEARLICDNLLDFSHLTYVHAAIFQAGPSFAERLPDITAIERGGGHSHLRTALRPDFRKRGLTAYAGTLSDEMVLSARSRVWREMSTTAPGPAFPASTPAPTIGSQLRSG